MICSALGAGAVSALLYGPVEMTTIHQQKTGLVTLLTLTLALTRTLTRPNSNPDPNPNTLTSALTLTRVLSAPSRTSRAPTAPRACGAGWCLLPGARPSTRPATSHVESKPDAAMSYCDAAVSRTTKVADWPRLAGQPGVALGVIWRRKKPPVRQLAEG